MTDTPSPRRIAIIGAGPVGLEAAHAFAKQGHDVHVYERGDVAQSVRDWGHVTLFSAWNLNTSPLGLEALGELGLSAPDPDVFPTGAELVSAYLEPLARHPRLEGRVHTHTTLVGVAREGVLKGELIASAARRDRPFRLLLEDAQGDESIAHADVLIDASGTYGNPNALGDGGVAAPGERKAARDAAITYTIPDVLGADRARFEGRHTLVVGAGYSAATTLNALAELAQSAPDTRVTWVTRGGQAPYSRIEGDPLPQRDALSAFANTLTEDAPAALAWRGERVVERVERGDDGRLAVTLRNGTGAEVVDGVDHIVANVGYRPELGLYRELQVHQCYASEGPMKLAAALLSASGGGGDCLQQTSLCPETLTSPEPDFFVLGSKSYGRGSAFLLKLGLEQIEDLKALL